MALSASGRERKDGIEAVQRLNRGLLVEAEDGCMLGRIDVEPDDRTERFGDRDPPPLCLPRTMTVPNSKSSAPENHSGWIPPRRIIFACVRLRGRTSIAGSCPRGVWAYTRAAHAAVHSRPGLAGSRIRHRIVHLAVCSHRKRLKRDAGSRHNWRRTSAPPDSRYCRMSTALMVPEGDSLCGSSRARKLRFFAVNGRVAYLARGPPGLDPTRQSVVQMRRRRGQRPIRRRPFSI
jgi:hypothetical protein